MTELQEKIERLLKKGWSYRKIAKELGVSKTTISRWHKGESKPSLLKHYKKIDSLYKESEQKFKVGDRVEICNGKDCWVLNINLKIGDVGTIKKVNGDMMLIDFDKTQTFNTDNNPQIIDIYKDYIKKVEQDNSKINCVTFEGVCVKDIPTEVKVDIPIFETIDEEIRYHEEELVKLKAQKGKEKWKFTEDEKELLRKLPHKYKYIARDTQKELQVFVEKPFKTVSLFGNKYWYNYGVSEDFGIFNHKFKCIQWSDSEPCEFRKFI